MLKRTKGLTLVIWQIFLLFNVLTLAKTEPFDITYILRAYKRKLPSNDNNNNAGCWIRIQLCAIIFLFVAWNEWCGQFCRYSLSFPQHKLENIYLIVVRYLCTKWILFHWITMMACDSIWFGDLKKVVNYIINCYNDFNLWLLCDCILPQVPESPSAPHTKLNEWIDSPDAKELFIKL